jgi:aspartate racemase
MTRQFGAAAGKRPSIGILGGMGPRATHYFVEELLDACERLVRPACDQDYPDMHVHFACSNPDRTAAMVGGDAAGVRRTLLREVQQLVARGCDPIVVPCLSAHAVLDPVPESIPLLDLRRVTFEYLATRIGGSCSVGVLGTRGTSLSIRRGALRPFSKMAVQVLSDSDEERLMSLIYRDVKTGAVSEATIDGLLRLCGRLRRAGATVVVAGCTEVEMCLASSRRTPPYVVFPLRLTARRLMAAYAGQRREPAAG